MQPNLDQQGESGQGSYPDEPARSTKASQHPQQYFWPLKRGCTLSAGIGDAGCGISGNGSGSDASSRTRPFLRLCESWSGRRFQLLMFQCGV